MDSEGGNPKEFFAWTIILLVLFYVIWLMFIGPQEDPGRLFLEKEDVERVHRGL